MWSCNWGPSFPHTIVGALFTIMMLVTILYIIVLTVRTLLSRNTTTRDAKDSLEILKAKFAGGEISAEEYRRMKDILSE